MSVLVTLRRTGKDAQTGNESKKGGTMKGSAMAAVRKDLVKSGGLMSSERNQSITR